MWPWQYFSEILRELRGISVLVAGLHADLRAFRREVNSQLKFLKTRAADVGPLFIHVSGESAMGLKFQVAVPPPTAGDVVKGELLVKINGGEAIVVATAVDQSMVEDDRFVGPDGATVELAYSLIDDAGNRSIPREFVAQLVDTFAPPQPGELSLTVVGEVDDPQPEPVVDPVVEPVVEPVVDEDLPDLEVNS